MIKEDSLVNGRPLSMDSNNSIDHDSLDSQIATLNSLIISDQDSLLDTYVHYLFIYKLKKGGIVKGIYIY